MRLSRSGNRILRTSGGRLVGVSACGGDCVCRGAEILFMVDTTSSMDTVVAEVVSALSLLAGRMSASSCKVALVSVKDCDIIPTDPFTIEQPFTTDISLVQAALAGLTTSGGGDEPEAHLLALQWVAENWTDPSLGGSDTSFTRIVLLFSDAPPHEDETAEECVYPTREDVLTAMLAACVFLFAFDTPTPTRTMTLGEGGAIPYVAGYSGGQYYDAAEWTGELFADEICLLVADLVACQNDPKPCCAGFGTAVNQHCVTAEQTGGTGCGIGSVTFLTNTNDRLTYEGGDSDFGGAVLVFAYSCNGDDTWTVSAQATFSGDVITLPPVVVTPVCSPFGFTTVMTVPGDSSWCPGAEITFTVTEDTSGCGGDTITLGTGRDVIFSSAPRRTGRVKTVPGPRGLTGRVWKCVGRGTWCWSVVDADGRIVDNGTNEPTQESAEGRVADIFKEDES